jgi:hypothetical protein
MMRRRRELSHFVLPVLQFCHAVTPYQNSKREALSHFVVLGFDKDWFNTVVVPTYPSIHPSTHSP